MRSVMSHSFSRVPQANIPRSSFDRSHGYKTTFDAGKLIPFFVDEALPGDTFNARLTAFARMATPIYPIMDNLFMDFFFFAVPHRLIWENWEKFCGARDNPTDSIDFTVPTVTVPATGFLAGGIADYFGIPTAVAGISGISSLPFRAYWLIWNEWFKDQNIQTMVPSAGVPTDDGPDDWDTLLGTTSDFVPRRGKRHDYFTSCLPWPQKGDSVALPLGTTAPVGIPGTGGSGGELGLYDASQDDYFEINTSGATAVNTLTNPISGANYYLYADLSSATAATINQLRQAFQIQRLQERDARGGTRYTEIVRSHFGVVSPDARLQRPEYLGGGSVPVNVSAVAATAVGDTNHAIVGQLAAVATAAGQVGFVKSFTEHCVIIGMVNVRADLTYQQGLNRMWSRSTRYDFYWPALSMIGEQAVLNKEIYAQGTGGGTDDDDVFGYQERYAEYRYKPSMVTGAFRSNHATSLDAWHLSQEFASLPTLGPTFIVDNPPIDRVVAVTTEPDFIFDSYMSLRCARPMPLFGVPGMIDHF